MTVKLIAPAGRSGVVQTSNGNFVIGADGGAWAAPADEAVGTVDTVARTISPTSAPNAVKCFEFFYSFNMAA